MDGGNQQTEVRAYELTENKPHLNVFVDKQIDFPLDMSVTSKKQS